MSAMVLCSDNTYVDDVCKQDEIRWMMSTSSMLWQRANLPALLLPLLAPTAVATAAVRV